MSPEHIGAAIGLAEAWCCTLYWLKPVMEKASVDELSMEALKLLDRVRPRATKSWNLHAVVGFLFTEMDRIDFAKELFSQASSLSRASTESYPPFLQFLVRSGGADRALLLSERYLESRLAEPNAYIAHADLQLQAGYYEDALKTLESALRIHGSFALVHHRLFLIHLVKRRADEVILHYDPMARLLDPLSFEATIMYARNLVDAWPKEERRAWDERMKHERRRERAISRALKSALAKIPAPASDS